MIYHTLERFSSYKKKKLRNCLSVKFTPMEQKTLRRLTCNTTGVIKR
jgi:hypothetical protein